MSISLQNFSLPLLWMIIILFLTVIVTKWMSSKSRGAALRMPPGPWKLPVIGNLQLIGVSMYHHKFTSLAKRHGPIVHLQIGELCAVLISSPELAEHVLRTSELNFAQRPQLLDQDLIPYQGSSLIFSPYNDYWKHIRRITMSDLLGVKRMQTFSFVRESEVGSLVETIYKAAADGSVNLSDQFYTLSNNIITRSVLGNKSVHQEEFRNALNEMTRLTGKVGIHDLFPSCKFLHFVTWKRVALRRVFRRLDKVLAAIIDEHKAVDHSRSREKDLLDLLLNVNGKDATSSGLTIDNIKNYVLDVFAGGSKPTRAILEWAMSELLRNPRIMEKAQAEVRSSVQGKSEVDKVDIQSLPYLNSVIKETFRLHMPGPLIPREAREDCKISGYDIPKKARIFVNQWAMSRDPKYWNDAESFKPERFLMSSTINNIHGMEYIPFGAGRRICPGQNFALAFIRLALFQLLFHFDWKLPNGLDPLEFDMSESYDITTRRKTDLYAVAVPVHGTVMPDSNTLHLRTSFVTV